MKHWNKITIPPEGRLVEKNGEILKTPLNPIVLFIEGEGVGPDIMTAAKLVLDKAISSAYGATRSIIWAEIYAGEKALKLYGEFLPPETLDAIQHFHVCLKGPLGTPVGKGFRSLNVSLRQKLDLYACVRPIRYFAGVPSKLKNPEELDLVIFRENTEDVYAGFEWPKGSAEALMLIRYLNEKLGTSIRDDAGVGIKPISEFGSKRLVRKAIRFALDQGRKNVTIVHKGNIMKYTEGAFREWGYDVALQEFREAVVTENEVQEKYGGKTPEGKIVIKDRIADNMFQQILLRPREYEVLATPNLDGDLLSDAAAGLVGGLGIAPGANIGEEAAVFEATHGTAPKYAGKNVANPSSLILSGVMMLEYLGWNEAAALITKAVEQTIASRRVTQDFAREMKGVQALSTSEFTDAILENLS